MAPVDRLVSEVMSQEPYKSAHRVFWIMDNCSAHRGQKAVERLRSKWPNALLIHTPIHASWLNQIEIYFSIVQRKALTPNDFSSLAELEQRLLAFHTTTSELLPLFSGRSHVATFRPSWPRWVANASPPRPEAAVKNTSP
jgi:transposase